MYFLINMYLFASEFPEHTNAPPSIAANSCSINKVLVGLHIVSKISDYIMIIKLILIS